MIKVSWNNAAPPLTRHRPKPTKHAQSMLRRYHAVNYGVPTAPGICM